MAFTKPMQPCNAEIDKIEYPALTQPKINGMKLVIKTGEGTVQVLTRSMKEVANVWLVEQVQQMFSPLAKHSSVFEAEAQNGDSFFKSKGLVSAKYREFGSLKLHVFDMASSSIYAKYSRRYALLKGFLSSISDPRVILVKCTPVHNHEELAEVCAVNSANHALDGTIVRQPQSLYKAGKCTVNEGYVLKIKNQNDMEVVVVDATERMINTNEKFTNELGRSSKSSAKEGLVPGGTLGAFVCKTQDGKDVRVASMLGVSDEERLDMWSRREDLVGKLIKITYMDLSEYGVPLHPVFIGFRDKIDLD